MNDPFKIGDRFDALLQRAENETIETIYKVLAASYQKLEAEIRSKYQKYTAENLPSLTELQRSSLLLQEVKKLLDLIPEHLQETLDNNIRQLLNTAYENGGALAQALIENINPNFSVLLPTIPIEALEHAATNAMNWLQGASSAFRATASSVIQQGLVQNRGVNWTAAILRRTLGITQKEAEGITRTATLQATDTATRQTYEANGIDYVSRVATADDRVCGYCAQRAGSIYRRSDTVATLHLRCRCYLMPIKPEWIKSGLVDLSWETSHYNACIADCSTPSNSGVTQFEKAAGLSQSPSPLWTPAQGFLNEDFERSTRPL